MRRPAREWVQYREAYAAILGHLPHVARRQASGDVAIEIKRGHAQFIEADRGGRAELILKGEVPYIPDPHGVETRMRSAWTASGSHLAAQHNFLSP